jgi:hypothetical protein
MITARKPRKDKRKMSDYEMELTEKLTSRGKVGGGQYSPTTIRNYVSKCRLAYYKCHPDGDFKDMEWSKDYMSVKALLADGSLSQRQGYYNSIITIAELNEDYPQDILSHYAIVRDALNVQNRNNYAKGGSAKKQHVADNITPQDVEMMMEKIYKPDDPKLRKLFMTWIMMKITIMFSLRNEVYSFKLTDSQYVLDNPEEVKKGNYLVFDEESNNFVILRNNYKTANGQTNVNPITDKQLIEALKIWISSGPPPPKPTKKDEPEPEPDEYSNLLGVRISSSLLVTIFSKTPTDLATATVEDTNAMLKQAKNRGHQIITKLLIYDLNKAS